MRKNIICGFLKSWKTDKSKKNDRNWLKKGHLGYFQERIVIENRCNFFYLRNLRKESRSPPPKKKKNYIRFLKIEAFTCQMRKFLEFEISKIPQNCTIVFIFWESKIS